MKAKEFLRQIKKMDKIIENKLIEKDQWKSIAMSKGSFSDGERVQSSGSQQKMADAINKYIDIEKEIDRCIDNLVNIKFDVIRVIEMLDIVEYDLLHQVYVQDISLYEVADDYGKTYSWATTTHGEALKNVQKILDERESKDYE